MRTSIGFVICHLSFVICHLSFVICYLSFVICHLSFVICHLSFVICHLSFVICYLSFVIFHLLFVIGLFLCPPISNSQIQIIPNLANRSMVACWVWRKCLRSISPSSIVLGG
ncbi:hypothetical protein CDG79_29810 [Nostoc sp. 'Peltigera membranacea cyanobiont' 232]|nr:hypothetical protein CDG79_29810 [Nostoc sp. 'Peltigera membranacea cyanobiont' 232]